MKITIASVVALVACRAFAAPARTSIEFKLTAEIYTNNRSKEISLSSLNKKLAAAKVSFPGKIAVSALDAQEQYDGLMKKIEKANKVLGLELHSVFDRAGMHEMPAMCYRGDGSKVHFILDSMSGNILDDDQGIQGIRFEKSKFIQFISEFFETNDAIRQNDIDNGNEAEMKMWDNYNVKSSTVLVLSDYGSRGDGIELRSTEIKPCKK